MTSSDEGLGILRDWQTKKTLLWFVSLMFSDFASIVNVRVKSVTFLPASVVVTVEGSGEELRLACKELREADPIEEPPPFKGVRADQFVRLLFLKTVDERLFVFGERRLVS